MRRIGIFGGTFNPPHIGHKSAGDTFFCKACLDKLYVIPTYITPLKVMQKADLPQSRLEMTSLLFRDYTVSDIEIAKGTPSYTCDTVSAILEMEEVPSLCLYVGSDMFFILQRWKNFEYLFDVCEIYTVARCSKDKPAMEETAQLYTGRYNAKIHIMDFEPIEISSTAIRSAVADARAGKESEVKKYLTEDVFGYIMKNGLYEGQV